MARRLSARTRRGGAPIIVAGTRSVQAILTGTRSIQVILAGARSMQCSIAAFDIAGFGDRRRDDEVQLHVRAELYRILRKSFEAAGVPWQACHREDRGDGVLVVVPGIVPTELLISPLVERVRAGLRRHNKLSSEIARIRLRMALHTGHVHFDAHGVAGQSLVHVFRLLEAPAFKTVFAATPGELGFVASDRLYDDVIRHGPGLVDPEAYDPIHVSVKETETRAWVYLPPGGPRPVDALRGVTGRRGQRRDVSQEIVTGMP